MKLKLLLITLLFSLCVQAQADWFLRGTHNGWAAAQMTSAGTNTVQANNVVFTASGSFKFDRFGDWKENYGVGGSGGGNIPIAAGTWNITFFTNTKTWTIVQATASSSSLASSSVISSSKSSSSVASASPVSSSTASSSSSSSVVSSSAVSSSAKSSSSVSSSVVSSSPKSSSSISSSVKSSSVSSSSAGPRYHLRGTFNAWAEGDLFTPVAGSSTNFEICRNFVPDTSGPRFKVDPNGGWGGDQFPAADVPAKGWSKIVISINGNTKTIVSNTNNMAANCGAVSSSSSSAASSSVISSSSLSSSSPSSSTKSSSSLSSSAVSSFVLQSSSSTSSSQPSSLATSSSIVSSAVASSSLQSSSVSSSSRIKVATLYYVHNDHLGTPQVVTNQAQQVVYMADYQPFGKLQPGQVNSVELYSRFPGQSLDGETGLYYNYFRDYDPSIGRYIQSDPIGILKNYSDPEMQMAILMGLKQDLSLGGLNPSYSYALNNPMSYSDFYGLSVFSFGGDSGDNQSCPKPDDGCAALIEKINIAKNGIARRFRQLLENAGNIDQTTHWEQLYGRQRGLRKLLLDAETKGCSIPSDAWHWATK